MLRLDTGMTQKVYDVERYFAKVSGRLKDIFQTACVCKNIQQTKRLHTLTPAARAMAKPSSALM